MNELTTEQEKSADIYDVLNNQRTAQKILHYLSTNDVHNLMVCNKKMYIVFKNPQTYIYNKYMYKKYKDNYIFFYHNNIKIKKLHQILEVINYSDDVYKKLYNITDIMVIIFYFSGCILILDIFVLFVMLDNSVNHFDDFLPQIPLVIFWALCIVILVLISLFERHSVNKVKQYFRQKHIVNEGNNIEKKLLENISKRLRNQKPASYRAICYTYILCFIPVIYRYFNKHLKYSSTFLICSLIFCSTGFIYDISTFFYYKFTHKISKSLVYYTIFSEIDPNYYYYKMRNIISYYPEWNSGEARQGFQYYLWLAIFHGVIIFYAFLIGKKLDNSNFTVSWRILLIPLYIACFIIVLWGVIYIYSIKKYKSEYKWILIITIIIIMVCTITNCVFWPNFYLKHKSITRYFPIVIDGIITITCMVHYFFLYKSKKKYVSEEI